VSAASAARELTQLPDGLALVALGANLGARKETLEAALEALDARADCELALRSSWHATAPVGGPPGQPEFLNGVALIYTQLTPEQLLEVLHAIEAHHGRERSIPNGPRTLDLDLLLHGTELRPGPGLILPHPRLHARAFVLAPLVELCPALELCGGTAAELLDGLVAQSKR